MCKLCKCLICQPNCPNWTEDRNTMQAQYCVLCGKKIAFEELYYERHGFPYCEACLCAMDGESLVRICEKSTREWLEEMGFLARIAKEEA